MDTAAQTSTSAVETRFTRWEWVQLLLFTSWNVIFMAFMLLGFAPILLPEIFTAVRTGTIPAPYLAYALILALIPFGATLLARTALRRDPAGMFALGCVVEGPLMLVLAVRFFAIRQATAGVLLLVTLILLGMAAFLWTLLDRRVGSRGAALEGLRLAGLTLMALASLYASTWIAFYAVPVLFELLRGLGNLLANLPRTLGDLGRSMAGLLRSQPLMLPFSVLGFILLLYTATLLVLTPISVPVLSLRTWWRAFSGQAGRLGWLRPAALSGATLVIAGGLFALALRQPQRQIFAELEKLPASQSEASALVKRSDSIRAGLLNAYLAPFRYISAVGEVRHIRDLYAGTFRISQQQAFAVQRLYEGLASPLLYQPVHLQLSSELQDNRALVEEPQEAAQLYQQFFDQTITDGERGTIVKAVSSTWSSDQAEAALQVVDDRKVHLTRQEVSLAEHGDWADLELHEIYQNRTADLQEVVYYFNLPESAVITGVWLGNSDDKAAAFKYQVAPRGAAQAVYREETRVMRDPALVEQIGPRQYRLRVYPVPQLRMTYDQQRSRTIVEDAPELHLWLAWREMASPDGWPLPRLAVKRNVYWDGGTVRLANGQPVEVPADAWMPDSLSQSGPITPRAHRVDLPGGQTVLALPSGEQDLPLLPDSLRLAVVLDRSRSMQEHSDQAAEALNQLKELNGAGSSVDVYLSASPYRGEEPSVIPIGDLDPSGILYFGGQNAAELIAQFESLRGDRPYDAVILLTDGSGYELGQSEAKISPPDAPVWIVHLGDGMPIGYDDQTLEAVQASGGGVAGDLKTALARLAVSLAAPAGLGQPVQDLLDGYLWVALPTGEASSAVPAGTDMETHDPQDGFAALAARRIILAEMQRSRGSIDQLETLDYLHSLAVRYGIVTPYSSMIVLVEEQQQQLLDDLSKLEDRYQREVENLSDTTPVTPVPLAGVPEPQEWLLMALAAGMLAYLGYKKKMALAYSRG